MILSNDILKYYIIVGNFKTLTHANRIGIDETIIIYTN